MKNIVIVPCWRRGDFLSVCLEHIANANGADRNVYLLALDRNYSQEVNSVVQSFGLEKVIRYSPHHRFTGNTYNVLEAYRLAHSLVPQYDSRLIYLVEEDIFVGKDFFDFHERVNEQHDAFCVSAVRNQNDERAVKGSLGDDPARVYKFGKYQSLGVSWKPHKLPAVLQHARMEYYSGMGRYLARSFPKSAFGTMWNEQDGLINRVMEAGKHEMIYPVVPRAYHAGFVGYNRKGQELTGSLEYRAAYLKQMTAEEMNAKAEVYKDIIPIDLTKDHGVTEYHLL